MSDTIEELTRIAAAADSAGDRSSDLVAVVEAWDGLPEAVRAGIVAMVNACATATTDEG